jgi:hypothetical protein
MWYFWLFMVPKSLIVFYIMYYPNNMIGAPVNMKAFLLDIGLGLLGMTLIGVQRVFAPRFLGIEKSKNGWIHGMNVFYLKDAKNSSNSLQVDILREEDLIPAEERISECGICWEEFNLPSSEGRNISCSGRVLGLLRKGRRPV